MRGFSDLIYPLCFKLLLWQYLFFALSIVFICASFVSYGETSCTCGGKILSRVPRVYKVNLFAKSMTAGRKRNQLSFFLISYNSHICFFFASDDLASSVASRHSGCSDCCHRIASNPCCSRRVHVRISLASFCALQLAAVRSNRLQYSCTQAGRGCRLKMVPRV